MRETEMGGRKKILANVKLNIGCFKAGLANYGLCFTSSLLSVLSSTAKNVSVFLNGWEKIQKKYYICDTRKLYRIQLPVSISKALLEHSYVHMFMYHLWLFSHHSSGVEFL